MQIAEPRRGAGPGPTSEALWIFVCCKSLFNKIKINEGVDFSLVSENSILILLTPCLSFSLFFPSGYLIDSVGTILLLPQGHSLWMEFFLVLGTLLSYSPTLNILHSHSS